MPSPSTLAAIRFGYGLSPLHPAPDGVGGIIGALNGPDLARDWFPMVPYDAVLATIHALNVEKRALRKAGDKDSPAAKALRHEANEFYRQNLRVELARLLATPTTLHDRLTAFWADHFTVVAKAAKDRAGVTPYVNEAIRPHIAGRFADMLKAVATHPMMLLYLDQSTSFGPTSKLGLKQGKGLNENLAREILELHTLGVGAPYTQQDVREFAELLTGLRMNAARGFFFDARIAEPGSETVLDVVYDGDDLASIHAALEDLALHPATAAHLARKLAVHFVSDSPDADLVAHMEAHYLASGGDLGAVTVAMLEHPGAWGGLLAKAKRPKEFLFSAIRALGVTPEMALAAPGKLLRGAILQPLRAMGQPYQRPNGPDGWDEDFDVWITPQGLAGRIQWAMAVPRELGIDLPDPRDFVDVALGDAAGAETRFAAKAAETREEGIGLVLSSPEFNRR